MFKSAVVSTFVATYASAAPTPGRCGEVLGFTNTMYGCGCLDQWARPIPGTDVCKCLDNTTMWLPNGSACGVATAEQTAYVNSRRTQYDFKNDAGTRSTTSRKNLASWNKAKLDGQLAAYE
jgi:hypothetical protein